MQPNPVIGGVDQILFGAEVAFGGGDGGMAEQELDLFEFPAPGAAEFGAGAAQVMRSELESQLPTVKLDHGKDGLGRERRSGNVPVAVQRTQQAPGRNSCGLHPDVYRQFAQAGTGMVRRRLCLPL